MAYSRVTIVHDEFGNIVSVSRPESDRVIVLSGANQSALVTEVAEEEVEQLIHTSRVDMAKGALVAADGAR